jgi:8-oxo-dGTP pyrophosphatase MutT (NUDIX family)
MAPASPSETIQDLETRLRRRLTSPLPGPDAQRAFAPSPILPGWSPGLTPSTAREAAALLLLYPDDSGRMTIPLTVRHESLPHHPGQVSLPGGALHAGESAREAALREAEEEIGVCPADIRVVGALSTLWVSVSNFVARPFVAVTDRMPVFRPHPGEVSQLLEVPLADVRDPARVKWNQRDRNGVRTTYRYFDLAGHEVWGATAMMLGEFIAVLDSSSD